jgi:hypothetical protein
MPVYVAKFFVKKTVAIEADTAQEVAAALHPMIAKEQGLLLSVIRTDLEPPPEAAAATGDAA